MSAYRSFSKLDARVRVRIGAAIDSLAENPRPAGVKRLAGSQDFYRIRVGQYRVVYSIEDDRLVVRVVKLGHRRDVYRGNA